MLVQPLNSLLSASITSQYTVQFMQLNFDQIQIRINKDFWIFMRLPQKKLALNRLQWQFLDKNILQNKFKCYLPVAVTQPSHLF